MKIRAMTIVIWATVAAGFIISAVFYPKMPAIMASHWNASGQVDGYMNKAAVMFLMPAIMTGEALFFYAILLIDPLRKNIRKFRIYYEGFILLITGFLLAVHLFMIAWNLGIRFSMNIFMPLMLAILFFIMGAIMPRLRPNWFMGIRTPWTLSNETVWIKTHRLGGLLYKLAAIAVLFAVIWDQHVLLFVLVPVLTATVIIVLYSLVIYMKLR